MGAAASPLNTEGRWPANEVIDWHVNRQRCTGRSRGSHSPGGSTQAESQTTGFSGTTWATGRSQRQVDFQWLLSCDLIMLVKSETRL